LIVLVGFLIVPLKIEIEATASKVIEKYEPLPVKVHSEIESLN